MPDNTHRLGSRRRASALSDVPHGSGRDPQRARASQRLGHARVGATLQWLRRRGGGLSHRATRGAAWLALLLSLALTVAASRFAHERERQAARADLEMRVGQYASRLSARMLAYEQLLRGGAGLFAALGGIPRRDDWRDFVATLGLASLPGIEGIGWAQRVNAAEAGAFAEAMRRDGAGPFRIHPPADAAILGPVTYLEPMEGRNLRAFGFDMYGEPVRRAAMQRAIRTGRPSLTARVVLVQEGTQPQQAGFLAYLPVYRPGRPLRDEAERDAAHLGWVYAAFRAGDFVEGAIGPARDALHFEIRDAREDGALLYASPAAAERDHADVVLSSIPMADREWELVAWLRPGGQDGLQASLVVAVSGAIGSLLIFSIVWTLATTRSRALGIADRMTVALRQANESLELRVRERTASLRDSNDRLASVNEKLGAVNAAFGVIGVGDGIADRLASMAAQLRGIVSARVALAVAFRADPGGGPAFGLDADRAVPVTELERWRHAAAETEPPTGEGPLSVIEAGRKRLHAPLLDAHGRTRGYLLLERAPVDDDFAAEDAAVLAQFALLVGSSLSLHETLGRERHARAEAERADRAKDEMLAVVSHELRTPLNAIQGWLHVLRRRRADDPALLDRALDVIQRNLDTQVQLVEDLLDTVRIVSGKLRLELLPLDLARLLRTAVETVRPLAESKRITLELTIAPNAYRTVGDASRLEQVVWNLLTNAVKFTPTDGHIAVRLDRIGWIAQIEVEDDGQGIEPAFLPQAFDRFRQADSSSTRAAGGLGLGLALVRHIVQAHGGQVAAHSEGAGRGACFTVSLPLGGAGLAEGGVRMTGDGGTVTLAPDDAEADAEADARAAAWPVTEPQEEPAPLARLDGLNVLVVEDHDDSRELLTDFLRAHGATVFAAANAREAMERARELPLDGTRPVLLCDIALPGENGYALLARLREFESVSGRPPGSRLIAFALSAFTRSEDRQRSLQAGFAEHFGKPLSQVDLVERLARLHAGAAEPAGRAR